MITILATISMLSSSCSKEINEGGNNYKGYGYLELIVNGKSYKYNDIIGMYGNFGGELSCRQMESPETPDADFIFYLYYYRNEKDFKNTKVGEYKISQTSNNKNFDLDIDVYISGSGYYNYASGGTHTVSNIKLLSTDSKSGTLTYLVEGTFSCSYKHSASGKTLELSGKYWTKLEVDPESKL